MRNQNEISQDNTAGVELQRIQETHVIPSRGEGKTKEWGPLETSKEGEVGGIREATLHTHAHCTFSRTKAIH